MGCPQRLFEPNHSILEPPGDIRSIPPKGVTQATAAPDDITTESPPPSETVLTLVDASLRNMPVPPPNFASRPIPYTVEAIRLAIISSVFHSAGVAFPNPTTVDVMGSA